MKGSVGHFELPADDVKRASAFYEKTFEWNVMPMPEMQYTMLGTTSSDKDGRPTTPGAINGGMAKRGSVMKAPIVTIIVEDIEAAQKLIVANGGKVLQATRPVGDMGLTAYFSDTEGNTVGLYQSRRM
jgi:uncharacterized protein